MMNPNKLGRLIVTGGTVLGRQTATSTPKFHRQQHMSRFSELMTRRPSEMTFPVSSSIDELLRMSEDHFPKKWRADCWYLSMVAALVGIGQPSHVGALYSTLAAQQRYFGSSQRQELIRRLREALIKCIPRVGIPTVIEAILSIVKVERPEDQDHSFTRENWQADEANHLRARKVIDTLYQQDHGKVKDSFEAHQEIAWISTEISYGFFLVEYRVLDMTETELVVLPAIMAQNLQAPTMWHQRGCLRVGISEKEVEQVQQVTTAVALFGGRTLDKIGYVSAASEDS